MAVVREVGIIGSGPGVRSLHVPTLRRLPESFVVRHVSDSGSGRSEAIARELGARSSTGTDELLADPRVDIVAVCSPPHRHADHVLAAVAAGHRAIFCEKPLATTELDARAVIDACRATGTSLLVGTNHSFDPAWMHVKEQLEAPGILVQSATATIALPPNGRYHNVVSEPDTSSAAVPSRGAPDWTNPEVAADVVRQLVLGLAIHELPSLRELAPGHPQVVFARPVPPIGYQIGLIAGEVLVQLNAVMLPGGADALWQLSIGTSNGDIDIDFMPAFVHAGGGSVTVRGADGVVTRYPPSAEDGYVAEWRALARMLDDNVPTDYDSLLDDVLFAIRIADASGAAVRESFVS